MFYMEIFIIAAWEIWKQRNRKIFDNVTPSVSNWKIKFKNELSLHMHRVKDQHREVLFDWLDSIT